MAKAGILILALMVTLVGLSFAWTDYTNVVVAKLVLLDSYPRCAAQIEEGALAPLRNEVPDAELGEAANLHCDTLTCPAYDPKYCVTANKTCMSETMAGKVKSYAKGECNCEQAKRLAEAITYYIAKYDPMHLMIREKCHEEFNNEVEKAIRSGAPAWEVKFKCTAPSREFVFSSQKYGEMLYGAKTFAFAEAYSGTQPWFCYNLGQPGTDGALKRVGALCSKNAECESGKCSNNVCCNAEVCCPSPGVKGFPCNRGERCNSEYTCELISAGNGETCTYDEECASGNCKAGSGGTTSRKYCCSAGNSYCCVSDSDCATDEECKGNVCKQKLFIPTNNTTQAGNGEEKPPATGCLPFIVLLAAFGGMFLLGKSLARKDE